MTGKRGKYNIILDIIEHKSCYNYRHTKLSLSLDQYEVAEMYSKIVCEHMINITLLEHTFNNYKRKGNRERRGL